METNAKATAKDANRPVVRSRVSVYPNAVTEDASGGVEECVIGSSFLTGNDCFGEEVWSRGRRCNAARTHMSGGVQALAFVMGRADNTTPPVSSKMAAISGSVFWSVMRPSTAMSPHTR